MSVATTYADALYEAAVDGDAVLQVAADVDAFAEAVEGSPELRMALDNPEIDSRAKASVIAAVAADAHALVGSFLQVLVERGRIAEFLEIAQAFRERVARAQARIEVEAVTAVPLPDDLRVRIVESIQSKTHATVELTESVQPRRRGRACPARRRGGHRRIGAPPHRGAAPRPDPRAGGCGRRPRMTPHAHD